MSGFQVGNRRAHRLPVAKLGIAETRRHVGQARRVIQDMAQPDLTFAMDGKLGPDIGNARVVTDLAALDEKMDQRGRDSLGRGKDREEGFAVHFAARGGIGNSGEGINRQLGLNINRDLDSTLRIFRNELIQERLNGLFDIHLHHHVFRVESRFMPPSIRRPSRWPLRWSKPRPRSKAKGQKPRPDPPGQIPWWHVWPE